MPVIGQYQYIIIEMKIQLKKNFLKVYFSTPYQIGAIFNCLLSSEYGVINLFHKIFIYDYYISTILGSNNINLNLKRYCPSRILVEEANSVNHYNII